MKPRQRRMWIVLAILLAAAGGVYLVTQALRSNMVFFLTPGQVAAGEAQGKTLLRIGGLVQPGSFQRSGAAVSFVLADARHTVPVAYTGVLPDLFAEGKGAIAQGQLGPNGVLVATEVLAKHDENYMPPEVKKALDDSGAHPVSPAVPSPSNPTAQPGKAQP